MHLSPIPLWFSLGQGLCLIHFLYLQHPIKYLAHNRHSAVNEWGRTCFDFKVYYILKCRVGSQVIITNINRFYFFITIFHSGLIIFGYWFYCFTKSRQYLEENKTHGHYNKTLLSVTMSNKYRKYYFPRRNWEKGEIFPNILATWPISCFLHDCS